MVENVIARKDFSKKKLVYCLGKLKRIAGMIPYLVALIDGWTTTSLQKCFHFIIICETGYIIHISGSQKYLQAGISSVGCCKDWQSLQNAESDISLLFSHSSPAPRIAVSVSPCICFHTPSIKLREGCRKKMREKYGFLPNLPRTPPQVWSFFQKKIDPHFFVENFIYNGQNKF